MSMRFRQHMWMGEYFLRKDETIWKIDAVQDGKVYARNGDKTCIVPESEVTEVFDGKRMWEETNRIARAKALAEARDDIARVKRDYSARVKVIYNAAPDDGFGPDLSQQDNHNLMLAENDMLLAVDKLERRIKNIEDGETHVMLTF